MTRWLPAPVHIAGLRLAHAVRRRWWVLGRRFGRRSVRGCRVLVFDREERVLLIRHSYGDRGWTLPGGGLRRGEDPVRAAMREVHEETGCRLDPAIALGLSADTLVAALHEVHLIAGWTADAPQADGREILVAAFFAHDSLPEPVSSRFARELPGYVTRAKAARLSRVD